MKLLSQKWIGDGRTTDHGRRTSSVAFQLAELNVVQMLDWWHNIHYKKDIYVYTDDIRHIFILVSMERGEI